MYSVNARSDSSELPTSNLAKAVRHTLRIGILLSGCFFAVQPGMADTTNLPTVDVPNPPEYEPPEYDPTPDIDMPDIGGGWGDGGGGGGIGDGSDDPPIACSLLVEQKPAECPNPIPFPGGPDYGRERFASGSGIAKALYYHQQTATAPKARGQLTVALNAQTNMMAARNYTMNQINEVVFTYFANACKEQTAASNSYRIGLGLTVPERLCLDAMGKLQSEADQSMSFVGFFISWLNKEGIDLADLFPQTIVNALSPANSITVKANLITKDATCSRWWTRMEQNQCMAP